jgi:prepilin-type N-terminal cleavage/methylation domain-containing protein
MSIIHKKGFTIVELLVVIVVMGILAGITVIGYGAWREGSAAKVLKSDLNNVKTAMVSARNFGSGYPTAPSFSGSNAIFKPSDDVNLTYVSGSATAFCIKANSTLFPNIIYHISESDKEAQVGNC